MPCKASAAQERKSCIFAAKVSICEVELMGTAWWRDLVVFLIRTFFWHRTSISSRNRGENEEVVSEMAEDQTQ